VLLGTYGTGALASDSQTPVISDSSTGLIACETPLITFADDPCGRTFSLTLQISTGHLKHTISDSLTSRASLLILSPGGYSSPDPPVPGQAP
jgi:hypothetical protein